MTKAFHLDGRMGFIVCFVFSRIFLFASVAVVLLNRDLDRGSDFCDAASGLCLMLKGLCT